VYADRVPSARWGHALCMISESEAILIGGQGDKNTLCKDAVWQLDMRLYFQRLILCLLFAFKLWHCWLASGRAVLFCSFGQGSSLLWTHTLRPFIYRPISLAQGGEAFG